jgi:hypothetical protein
MLPERGYGLILPISNVASIDKANFRHVLSEFSSAVGMGDSIGHCFEGVWAHRESEIGFGNLCSSGLSEPTLPKDWR